MISPKGPSTKKDGGDGGQHQDAAGPFWTRGPAIDVAILMLGAALRWSMRGNFDYRWSYDFRDHLAAVRWVSQHFTVPSLDLSRASYHPPLYYFIAGTALRLGVSESHLGTISIICGVLRLVVLRAVFLAWLPRSAALVALLVAALQPTSIHLDGMATNEALSNLEHAVLLWLLATLLPRDRSPSITTTPPPWRTALAFGALMGLALLTKISTLSFVGALGLALLAKVIWVWSPKRKPTPDTQVHHLRRELTRARMRSVGLTLAPFALAVVMMAGVSGWYLVHNQRRYGKPLLAGYDGPDRTLVATAKGPLWSRRPVKYYFCWTGDIFVHPYYPSANRPVSCFWPQLVASSWVDFYRYGFANGGPPGAYRGPIVATAIASVVGGTVLALFAVPALLLWLARAWRDRDAAILAVTLFPIVTLVGLLYFATAYPFDGQGVVKGLYFQFAAPPLYAAVGLAVVTLARQSRHRWLQPLAVAPLAALAGIASYVVCCRWFS